VERFHGPIAGGLQPAGKGRAPSLTAVIRPRLPGAGALRACPGAGRRGRICRRTNPARRKGHAMRRPSHRSLITLQPAGKGCAPSPTAVIRLRLPRSDERSEIVLRTISAKNAAPVARPDGRRGRRGSAPTCRRTNPTRRKGRAMRRRSHRSLITLCRGRGGGAGATAGVGGDDSVNATRTLT
jgi:hypothetical protein